MGIARQARRSSALEERARKTDCMAMLRAVLVPCAQLRTNNSVSGGDKRASYVFSGNTLERYPRRRQRHSLPCRPFQGRGLENGTLEVPPRCT